MPSSTITSKGQTTIPGEIRNYLTPKRSDRVEFVVEPDGKVVLKPATVDIAELKDILAPAPRRVSLEDMEQRARAADVLEQILRTAQLTLENSREAWTALSEYSDGPDFSDALIALANLHPGCENTVTFDRKASRHRGFVLL